MCIFQSVNLNNQRFEFICTFGYIYMHNRNIEPVRMWEIDITIEKSIYDSAGTTLKTLKSFSIHMYVPRQI